MARPSRPASATLIAVCNILIGLPCLCCSGYSTVQDAADAGKANQAQAGNPAQANTFEARIDKVTADVEKAIPHHRAVTLASDIGSILGSLLLLVSGVGLLLGRPFGRWFCLVGAGLVLACSVVEVVEIAAFALPESRKAEANLGPPAPGQPHIEVSDILVGVIFLEVVTGVGYPLLAIVVMMTAPVRRFYRSRPAFEDEHDRYVEDEFDRPPDEHDGHGRIDDRDR